VTRIAAASPERISRLEQFAAAVIAENRNQNLISHSTMGEIWQRHILDSAQLLAFVSERPSASPWIDLGTGAGFPGMVIGILRQAPVLLVEERRRRAMFLGDQAKALGLDNVEVWAGRLETLPTRPASVISARAFAPLGRLFQLSHRFSGNDTLWLLPKGKSAREELETVAASWQGEFNVKPSLSDPDASIVVARHVLPKRDGR
jgi:16S rRNA (guanine527-N7)-methyltransferase